MKWIVQVYDDNGYPCKLPRYFEGSKEEVNEYINDRFGLADAMFSRTTIAYSKDEGYTDENIPQKIEIATWGVDKSKEEFEEVEVDDEDK